MQKLGKTKLNKILSVFTVTMIIGLLIFVGPVDALRLGLSGFKNTPYNVGETINFIGKIEIKSNERVNLQNVSLEVNDKIVCVFDVNGNLLTSCDGVNVSLVSNSVGFGYGYGYNNFNVGWNGSNRSSGAGNYVGYEYGYGYGYSGDGELVYNISMQTPQSYFKIPGNNEIKLISKTDRQMFNSRTEHIVIKPHNSGNDRNFLFGYDNANVLFWGKYNNTDYTFYGQLMVLNHPSIKLEGIGTYKPDGPHSGQWNVLFFDSNLSSGYGYFVEGKYNKNSWSLSSPDNRSIMVQGITYEGFRRS